MKKMNLSFDHPYRKVLTPQEFLKFYEKESDRSKIEKVEIIPATLGGGSLGRFVITNRYADYI